MKLKRLGVDNFSYKDIIYIIKRSKIYISAEARLNISNSFARILNILNSEKVVYGINTGVGILCDTKILNEQIQKLQYNLLLSHCAGVGNPVLKDISRIMLIAKVHALARGFSGVSSELIDMILLLINEDLIPVVPEQGSVGASGDLSPLSHLFLPLLGLGELWVDGKIVPTGQVFKERNITPISLKAKECLALINGTQCILSNAIYGLERMRYLLDLADLVAAASLEAFHGSAQPFHAKIHEIRNYGTNNLVARRIRHFLKDSQNLKSHSNCGRVQDPYSLRCIPQVHGASRTAWNHLQELVEIEFNSVTDNPLILEDGTTVSGGNFHGQPLAMAIDYCSMAMSEIGNISDRRCYLLLEGKNGLPQFLVHSAGINSGLMLAQYTTAALTSENKSMCFPASVDSIPTSSGQEDHVSMGSISSRKYNMIINNVEKILAIELMFAIQGLDFRRPNKFSVSVERLYSLVRAEVPFYDEDRILSYDIEKIIRLVKNRRINVDITDV